MNHQKNPALLPLLALSLLALTPLADASVTINYEVAEITSGGVNISSGTLFFISHGSDNLLQSTTWTSGNSFLLGDDKLFAAVGISNGVASGALGPINLPVGTTQNTTKFSGIFVNGLDNTIVDYATAQLLGGRSFAASGGNAYQYGSYRTDSIEGFGSGPTGNMAWVFPADGVTLSLSAYSGTGIYTGQDITATLATTAGFNVIPEPSSISLLGLGAVALLARRRRQA